MQHDLVDQHFKIYEEIKNDSMNGLLPRTNIFFIAEFLLPNCQKSEKKLLLAIENILNKIY